MAIIFERSFWPCKEAELRKAGIEIKLNMNLKFLLITIFFYEYLKGKYNIISLVKPVQVVSISLTMAQTW